jgi:glycosyltransferase involved in cell wall biosynthesis
MGFGDRYRLLLAGLSTEFDVEVLAYESGNSAWGTCYWHSGPHPLRRMAARGLLAHWKSLGSAECALTRAAVQADACVALVHPSFSLARPAAIEVPTILFAEEAIEPHRAADEPLRRPSTKEKMAESLVGRLYGCFSQVAVIADPELPWGYTTFPNARVGVVPHFIDLEYWTAPVTPARPASDVLVVGRLDSPRTADDLGRVLRSLEAIDPRGRIVGKVRVVTSQVPNPRLGRLPPRVEIVLRADDVRPFYESDTVVLVPPFHIRGTKTTILQAWAARKPVVTTRECAAALGLDESAGAVVFGDTPDEVASEVARVVASASEQRRLAESGYRRLLDKHQPRIVIEGVADWLRDILVVPTS